MELIEVYEYTCTARPAWFSYNATYHAHKCKYCGAFVGPYEAHVVNSSHTLCTVCGYTGPFPIIFDE